MPERKRLLVHLITKIDQIKADVKKRVTELYHLFQKPALFKGETKKYRPLSETDDPAKLMHPENTKVQNRVRELLQKIVEIESPLLDLVFQQDVANQKANADIEINGKILKANVPVTNLMYLHKRFLEILTAMKAIPTPAPEFDWVFDPVTNFLKTKDPVITRRTEKRPERFEKAPATDKHPAQVELLYVDTPVGEWTKTEFSGAELASVKEQLVDRVQNLVDSIRNAIQTANIEVEAPTDRIASELFDYVLEPIRSARNNAA